VGRISIINIVCGVFGDAFAVGDVEDVDAAGGEALDGPKVCPFTNLRTDPISARSLRNPHKDLLLNDPAGLFL
jgi:hypothetical protein